MDRANKRTITLEWANAVGLENSYDRFYSDVWWNRRSVDGFRVTPYGYEVMKEIGIKTWMIPNLDLNSLMTGVNLNKMDRSFDSPYYINTRSHKMYVTSEELAVQLILFEDISTFLSAI